MTYPAKLKANTSLNDIFQILADAGCYPSLYRRGNLWRFHINVAGNFWGDHHIPLEAARLALQIWKNRGRPMDGTISGGRDRD